MKKKKHRTVSGNPVMDICADCNLRTGLKCPLYVFEVFGIVRRRTLAHWTVIQLKQLFRIKGQYHCKGAPLIEEELASPPKPKKPRNTEPPRIGRMRW